MSTASGVQQFSHEHPVQVIRGRFGRDGYQVGIVVSTTEQSLVVIFSRLCAKGKILLVHTARHGS